MNLTSEEILFYITGKASPEVTQRCEELRQDPNSFVSRAIAELRQHQSEPFQLDWSLLCPDSQTDFLQPSTSSPSSSRPWRVLALWVFVFLVVTIGYYLADVARAAEAGKAQLQIENGQLKSENHDLQPAKAIVNLAESIDGPLRTVSFLPQDTPGQVGKQGNVHVHIQNAIFPCTLTWKVGEKANVVAVPLTGTEIDLPSGEIKITCEPNQSRAWFQSFSLVHNNTYLGSTLGSALLKVKDGDTLRVHLDQPVPPWNATMTHIKGEWVIVTLERPWADDDIKRFLEGKWNGGEVYPNSQLFWAKYGSAGLARELANHFVVHRTRKGINALKFRGKMHTSIIVPTTGNAVTATFQTITVDELLPHLTEAFEMLRKKRPPVGSTIQEDIHKAAKALQELNGDGKEP